MVETSSTGDSMTKLKSTRIACLCKIYPVALASAGAFAALTANISNAQDSCPKLNRYDCRRSTECSLDCKIDPKRPYACTSDYFCRPKADACERGFKQTDFSTDKTAAERCNSKPGCFLDKRGCYCDCEERPNTGCMCACGGGAPENCVSK